MSTTGISTSITAVLSQISQIESQISAIESGSVINGSATSASAVASAASVPATSSTPSTSFASALAQAQPSTAVTSPLLTTNQQQFAARLAGDTGLDPNVVSSWLLAEESGSAAAGRQSAGNNDWLNVGYTDSGTYGSTDSIWSNPTTAADATAGWLKGQATIPGYGAASSGVQAILNTAGQTPATQISAIQGSGWASSGYPNLPSLYQQITSG